jgi:PAS domain S-box-containing protein
LPGRQIWQAALPVVLLGLALLLALLAIFQIGVRRVIDAIHDAREKLAARNEELAQSEGWLRAVLDNAADAILTVTPEGEVVSANHAAGRILGGAPESLVGSPLSGFLASPFDWTDEAAGSREEARTVVRGLDGRERLVELSSSPIRTAEFNGYVIVAQDVTDRLTAQDALDLVRTPLLVLDRQLRVMLANRSALQLIDGHGGLSVQGEKLTFKQPREQAVFQSLLEAGATASMSGARPNGGPPLLLHVGALKPNSAHLGAVVHLQDLSRRVRVDPAAIQKLFMFTPAEARVVLELINGKAPAEIARDFSLSVSTVRNQLKQAFRKSGVRSQSELVVAVLSATAVMSE